MKIFTSNLEGQWTTPNMYAYTEADTELLNSEKPEDAAAKEALIEAAKAFIAANPTLEVTEAEAEVLNAAYNAHKPQLEEGMFYKFIAADITVFGEKLTGIINYRVSSSETEMGEHLQIRF